MALQEICHLALVLLGSKGAGRVDQNAARCQQSCGVVQNFPAQSGTVFYQGGAVLSGCGGFLAEHAFTGTGSVHQHPVKEAREGRSQAGGILIEDHGIAHTHPFQVLAQNLRPGGIVFVGHQQPLPLQGGG